ncbi:hypothetical protein LguiB_029962 [Lonicera macranthoides]
MSIAEISIIYHVGIVLVLLWLLSSFNCAHPVAYLLSLFYLYLIHDRYMMRLRRNIQFDERRQANQRRVLSDSETVRWLNHAVEKIWPVCMEQIVSQKILLPIVPWFLQKYKPWTVKDAMVQSLYMGRAPPLFTEIRVLRETSDDHLVLQLGMNFRTAEDMSAILAVKLRKRLGFGMSAKLHLMGMHVEGKVLVGVKFINRWPFLGRLRVCFVEPPYFQMTVKPLIAHGFDVTELPGIAGWIDKLLTVAFEETLVEPNMLVVDVEKFASPESENWFSVEAKEAIAYALVEVVEATDIKPSDLNGLADPYVKGQIGPYRFRTKTQKKTLSPKWLEEFKIPISTWESPNVLTIEVCDKDHFVDDTLGVCSMNICNFRDGQRHDIWLSLQKIKLGRLHLVITVTENNEKGTEEPLDVENGNKRSSSDNDTSQKGLSSAGLTEESLKVADKFEPVDIEGIRQTGIWVQHPGTEVEQVSEHKKGKNRGIDIQIHRESGDSINSFMSGSYQSESSSSDESVGGDKTHSRNRVTRGLKKIRSVFQRTPTNEDKPKSIDEPVPSSTADLIALNAESPRGEGGEGPEESALESPSKRNVKGMAKSIIKHAGKSARGIKHALSRKERKVEDEEESVEIEGDIHVGCDSIEEESLSSLVQKTQVDANSAISSPISSDGSASLNSEENIVRISPTGPTLNIVDQKDEISVESSQMIADKPSGSPKGHGVKLAEDCSDS